MSDVYNEYAIDLLQKFIETRNELTLQRVLNECFQHVVAVPPELALNVSIQLITLLQVRSTDDMLWWCLFKLMNKNINQCAKDYLMLLQNYPLLTKLQYMLSDNMNTSRDADKIFIYLNVLHEFLSDNYERQCIIFEEEGQHVLNAVGNLFQSIRQAENERLIPQLTRVIASLSMCYPEAIERRDQRSILWFLNMGGISRFSNILLNYVSQEYIDEECLYNIHASILIIYMTLDKLDTTGLDRELYCIDRNSAYRMAIYFYKIFTEDKIPDLMLSVTIIGCYTIYLDQYGLMLLLESFLLYKPPYKEGNGELVVEFLKFVRRSAFKNSPAYEMLVSNTLNTWKRQFPAVAALLDEPLRELPPDRDDKVRVCALPGCKADGKRLFCKMLKFGRCHNTYYCGDSHQKEHWKVHKLTCGSGTVVVTSAASSTGTTGSTNP